MAYHVDENDFPQGFTGCLPRPMKVGENPRFKVWGTVEECPTIPRSEWVTCSLKHKIWEVVNQSSQNTCACASTRGIMQLVREIMGLKRIRLSQGSVYNLTSGGRDQGANIMDVLTAMMDVGMAPNSVIDEYDWQGRDYPANWKAEAAKCRIIEAWDCPSFDELISAVQKSIPVVFGVNWSGGGGHAIGCIGYADGKAEILNSWGADWGDNGTGFLSESQCRAITSYGAFAIRAITIPSDEELPPPPNL